MSGIRRWTVLAALMALGAVAHAQAPDEPGTLDDLRQGIVGLKVEISPQARSASMLGTERRAGGVVIDRQGLVVTAGYAILEARSVEIMAPDGMTVPAAVVGYDAETGFGLVRALKPMAARPIPLGDSSRAQVRQTLLILTFADGADVNSALVVSRRTFAAYWEYLLEDALFTAPPVREYAGAALLDHDFRLVGVGSLFVQEAVEEGVSVPGNVFIPINALKPILADLVKKGRAARPTRPWLGVNVTQQFGRVIVTRVTHDGPAEAAGLKPGDMIFQVGGKPVTTLESFYRALWSQGGAGSAVPLTVLQEHDIRKLTVASRDRNGHYHTPALD
jgi:S1-C subfamily serine protease